MAERIRRIGVVTSGEDSPGQNAAVRAVVRMALHHDLQPYGVRNGFRGLMSDEIIALDSRSVSNTIGRGGSWLGSSRSDLLADDRTVREALRSAHAAELDALVVIGGEGSLMAARALDKAGLPTVGVPATIENDVLGTDMAIGVDTAMNTALEAIDRIKDTASSHQQAYLVETAGTRCGYLALMAGITGGAEMVCIPEVPFTIEAVARGVTEAYVRGKRHCIIVVAEGVRPRAQEMSADLSTRGGEIGFAVRLSMIGHMQRGGSPLMSDRVLATTLGAAAVEALLAGARGNLVGSIDGRVVRTPLADVAGRTRPLDPDDYALATMLAR